MVVGRLSPVTIAGSILTTTRVRGVLLNRFFSYVVIYWLVPRYFKKRRYVAVSFGLQGR